MAVSKNHSKGEVQEKLTNDADRKLYTRPVLQSFGKLSTATKTPGTNPGSEAQGMSG